MVRVRYRFPTALDLDRAGVRRVDAHDRLDQRRFTRAVVANEAEHFSQTNNQIRVP